MFGVETIKRIGEMYNILKRIDGLNNKKYEDEMKRANKLWAERIEYNNKYKKDYDESYRNDKQRIMAKYGLYYRIDCHSPE